MDLKNTKQELLNYISKLEGSVSEIDTLKNQLSFKDKLISQLQSNADTNVQAKQNDDNIKRITGDYEDKLKKYDEAYKNLADGTNRAFRGWESTLKVLQGASELAIDLEGYVLNSIKEK